MSKRGRISGILTLFLGLAAASGIMSAAAFTLSTGQEADCKVRTVNGEYSVPERSGNAYGFAGFTEFDTNGLPYFIFDRSRFPQVGQASGILADFLFYHECAHARFESQFNSHYESELGANCEGLRQMRIDGRISAAQEIEMAHFHANANISAALFSSGAAFWQLTLSCASKPSNYVETVYGSDPPVSRAPLGSFWGG